MVTFGGKPKQPISPPKPTIDDHEAELKAIALVRAVELTERLISRGVIPSKDNDGNLDYQKVVSFVHATTIHLAGRFLEWLKEVKHEKE